VLATLPGDFNRDGIVDGDDLPVWEATLASNGSADADADGDSDSTDFLVWQRHWGPGALVNAVGTGVAVPEPGATALLVAMVLVLELVRRRQSFSAREDLPLSIASYL